MLYNIFWQKNLHISKKSSTFAPDLEKRHTSPPQADGATLGSDP